MLPHVDPQSDDPIVVIELGSSEGLALYQKSSPHGGREEAYPVEKNVNGSIIVYG